MEEFAADDGMGDKDEELGLIDPDGVGVARVGGADELDPVVADRLLGGGPADLVFDHELFDQAGEGLGFALHLATRFLKRHPAQVADEFLGEFAELVRLVRHGNGPRHWPRKGTKRVWDLG